MAKKSKRKNLIQSPAQSIPQMEPWFDEAESVAVYKYMQSGGWGMEFMRTRELEKMIADYIGAKYCAMTINGTISLSIAFLALGLKAGDEAIVPDLTMIATANAAALLGIKPVFVDVEPITLCIDLVKAKRKVTKKTKVLVYVSFNGRSGNMKDVVKFCRDNQLFLVEDAAQALGSFWQGRHLGTFGDIGSFSLSAPKIITTGQGGILVTDNQKYFEKICRIKDFGRIKGGIDIHDDWGWNFKYTDIQAVIGIEQMKKLPWRVKKKKEIFAKYKEGLKNIREIKFLETDLSDTCPWFIDVFVSDPVQLSKFLNEQQIGTRRIYPPVSSQKIYKSSGNSSQFPTAEKYASRGLWLPSSSRLTDKEIDIVVGYIKRYYTSKQH